MRVEARLLIIFLLVVVVLFAPIGWTIFAFIAYLLTELCIWAQNSGAMEPFLGGTVLRPWRDRWITWRLANPDKQVDEDPDEPWLPRSLKAYYSRLALALQFEKAKREKQEQDMKAVHKKISRNERRRKSSHAKET